MGTDLHADSAHGTPAYKLKVSLHVFTAGFRVKTVFGNSVGGAGGNTFPAVRTMSVFLRNGHPVRYRAVREDRCQSDPNPQSFMDKQIVFSYRPHTAEARRLFV